MTTEIYWIQAETPGRLGIMPRPRGGEQLGSEVQALAKAGVETLVSLLTMAESMELELEGEAEECQKNGIDFLRFSIPDRETPALDFSTLTFLKGLSSELEQGRSVVIHCRMGIGRASIIAAATLVLSGSSPDAAFNAIRSARGSEVPDTPEQREWVARFAKKWRELQSVDELWVI